MGGVSDADFARNYKQLWICHVPSGSETPPTDNHPGCDCAVRDATVRTGRRHDTFRRGKKGKITIMPAAGEVGLAGANFHSRGECWHGSASHGHVCQLLLMVDLEKASRKLRGRPWDKSMTKLAAEWSWAYASRIREVGWNLIFKERPNSRQTERACCIYTSVQ